MCGIAGLINIGNRHLLQNMNDSISHRGPDDEGVSWFDSWNSGFGHRRLSIIDLSKLGHQPMSNEDDSLWITYNGEIYNYLEIQKILKNKGYKFRSNSDTEVILKGYEEWGSGILDKLNGMFSFAILNNSTGELFAARDRIGVKPFYYCCRSNFLIFSSEIKAILRSNLIPKEPDLNALFNPSGYQVSPNTGFLDIRKLPPGHFLKFANGKLEISRYWEIEVTENKYGNENDVTEKLDELLNDSVRLQMLADVPIGLMLSGGLDSSLIGWLMQKNTNKTLHTFTIKFSEQDQKFEKMTDDSLYAKIMSDKLQSIHHVLQIKPDIASLLHKMIYHLDEPLADPAAINTYLISANARNNGIAVLLNGMGGDEIFAGYRNQVACMNADLYQVIIPQFLRMFIEDIWNIIPVANSSSGFKYLRWAKRFFSFASLSQFDRYLASNLSIPQSQFERLFNNSKKYRDTNYYLAQKVNFDRRDVSYLTKMCLNDTKVFLPEHNLTYSDKACMATGLESRPPLTDHRIVEFMFSLEPKYRIKKNVQKYLLKKVAQKYLPKEIIYRPKAPFGSPLRSWIRGPLKEMVGDYLSEDSIKRRGLYNWNEVSKIIEKDKNGKEDNAQLIWQLMTNEIWLRIFFNN